MKKLTAFIFLFSAAAHSVSAQKKLYYAQNPKFIEWVEHPVVSPVPPEYANEDAIFLLHDVNVNFKYTGRDTSTFYTEHNIIKVLDERGIEMFNTIKIPLERRMRAKVKARTIDPSGEVHEIDKKMIQSTKDEYGRYMISVALEGVERNAEIEYTVEAVMPYDHFQDIPYQYEIPIANARFELSYPRDLVLEMKSHNGFPEVRDTLIKGRKRISVQIHDIPALDNEPNSFMNLHRMGIEYRASYITNGNNERIKLNTWNAKARNIFDTYYKLSSAERKAVNNFLSDLGVRPNGDEVQNIKKIEQGIKTRITQFDIVDYDERMEVRANNSMKSISRDDPAYNSNTDLIDTMLSKKAATGFGYVKLFAACFAQAGVRHELGMAGDRSQHRFDSQFESWIGLDDYIFYFPNQKKFLDPESIYLRYPVIRSEMVGGKGLFCTIPLRGEPTGNLYAIRTITPLSAGETAKKLAASVSFSKEMDPALDIAYSWSGYFATKLRQALPFYPKDKMKDLVTSLVPVADKPSDIDHYTISNEGFENYYDNKPLELYASVHPTRLVSKAGKQYIFRLGAILGNQSNLYAEERRKMPVDLFYPYSTSSTITVNIPKGFKVINPEVARSSADYVSDNEEVVISFSSDYRLVKDKTNGDRLIITVTQSCQQLHFTLNEYERYRKVINTAADFSKVTLLMVDNNKPHYAKKARKENAQAKTAVSAAPAPAPTSAPKSTIKVAPAVTKTNVAPVKAAPVKVAPAKPAPVKVAPAPAKISVSPPPPSGQIKVSPPPAHMTVGPPKK